MQPPRLEGIFTISMNNSLPFSNPTKLQAGILRTMRVRPVDSGRLNSAHIEHPGTAFMTSWTPADLQM
ncbi:hypothetical protein ANCDUO_08066 [Ancylostoma duodenale]|uniref:Uncharacterized protein n=1 Tax=Ancylostoma duodenale TaxID=51022 RepID=A0A0C2GWY2_9BILA|nr:hypothetical protein ANCDUO_08066 [Ancylostoma duodenale]